MYVCVCACVRAHTERLSSYSYSLLECKIGSFSSRVFFFFQILQFVQQAAICFSKGGERGATTCTCPIFFFSHSPVYIDLRFQSRQRRVIFFFFFRRSSFRVLLNSQLPALNNSRMIYLAFFFFFLLEYVSSIVLVFRILPPRYFRRFFSQMCLCFVFFSLCIQFCALPVHERGRIVRTQTTGKIFFCRAKIFTKNKLDEFALGCWRA